MTDPMVVEIGHPAAAVLGAELANDNGRRILSSLAEGPKSASQIAGELDLPLTTVVHHLEKMLEAGLISVEGRRSGRRGKMKVYRMSSPAMVILTTRERGRAISALRRWISRAASPSWGLRRAVLGLVLLCVGLGGVWSLFLGSRWWGQPFGAAPLGVGPPRAPAEAGPKVYGSPPGEAVPPWGPALLAAASSLGVIAGAAYWSRFRPGPGSGEVGEGIPPAVDDSAVPPDVVGAGEADQEAHPLPQDGAVDGVLGESRQGGS